MRAGTSSLGGNAPELHFGLGYESEPSDLWVTWPDGEVTRHELEGLDRFVEISR